MSTNDMFGTAIASPRRRTARPWLGTFRLGRFGAALVPGVVLLAIVLAAVFAPVIAPYDPDALDMSVALNGPSAQHWLGTDQLGRDQLSRLLYGGRATLAVTLASTVGTILLGLFVGTLAGYVGGRLDLAISTVITVLLALPSLLLTLAILGVLGAGTTSLLIALIGAGWVGHARVIRAAVLSLREQPYVEAARSIGSPPARIVTRELLPNLLPTVVVLATLDLGTLLLTVSSLSFLGLGVQPPTADWGVMLNDARPYFSDVPLLVVVPGLCIMVVALASNLLGDALRDLVDLGHRS